MTELLVIGWFLYMILCVLAIYEYFGYSGLTRMFPEGWRQWHFFAQIAALGMFTFGVLHHPWR